MLDAHLLLQLLCLGSHGLPQRQPQLVPQHLPGFVREAEQPALHALLLPGGAAVALVAVRQLAAALLLSACRECMRGLEPGGSKGQTKNAWQRASKHAPFVVSLSEVPRVPNWPDWDFCRGSWEVSAPVVDGCEAIDRRAGLQQVPGWTLALSQTRPPSTACNRRSEG